MKVLGISFGTKNGTNDSLCIEALMGAKEVGAEVKFIQMSTLNIKHCTGCVACSRTLLSGKGSVCTVRDDFEWLLDKMLDADGIIMSDPIFEEGASGLFHTISDRCGPRIDRGNNIIGTRVAEENGGRKPDPRILREKVVSYIGVGGSDWGSRVQCEHAMHALIPMWKVIDNKWYSWAKEIIMDDERLSDVHQVGVNLAEAAKDIENATYKGQEGMCSHCHNNLLYLTPGTNEAICGLCGMVGELKITDGKAKFVYPEEQLRHAHDTLPGKFIHADDLRNKIEGKFLKLIKTDEYKERKKKYTDFILPLVKE